MGGTLGGGASRGIRPSAGPALSPPASESESESLVKVG